MAMMFLRATNKYSTARLIITTTFKPMINEDNISASGDLFEDDDNHRKTQSSSEDLSGSNTEKDPDDWTTGDEPMTGAQKSYLKTLSDEAKEEFDENLTKAEASKRIDELQHKTGRGL
jgi:hypothetical protein